MGKSTTNIVGSSFYPGATDRIMRLKLGAAVRLEREPTNKYDKNAIAVHIFGMKVGHLSRGYAADIAPLMDSGIEVTAFRSPRYPQSCMLEVEWAEPETIAPMRSIRSALKPFFPALDLEGSDG